VSPVRIEHVPRTAGWHQAMTVIQVVSETSPTQNEIIAHCANRLARFKLRSKVKYVEVVSGNPSGQVLKVELRKHYWEGRERSVN
jgi:acyl-CoA synthetase (AMP-forming)/AMP-acid ligase II